MSFITFLCTVEKISSRFAWFDTESKEGSRKKKRNVQKNVNPRVLEPFRVELSKALPTLFYLPSYHPLRPLSLDCAFLLAISKPPPSSPRPRWATSAFVSRSTSSPRVFYPPGQVRSGARKKGDCGIFKENTSYRGIGDHRWLGEPRSSRGSWTTFRFASSRRLNDGSECNRLLTFDDFSTPLFLFKPNCSTYFFDSKDQTFKTIELWTRGDLAKTNTAIC